MCVCLAAPAVLTSRGVTVTEAEAGRGGEVGVKRF